MKQPTSSQILGDRLREARKAKGLSQDELAHKANMDRSYYGCVERGEENPSFNTLCSIARIVGSDLGKLCEGLPLPKR